MDKRFAECNSAIQGYGHWPLAWTALLLASTFTIPAQTLTGGTTGGKARFSPDGLRLL